MFSRLSLFQKGILLIAIPTLGEIVFIAFLAATVFDGDKTSARADRSVATVTAVNSLSELYMEAMTQLVLYGLYHRDASLAKYREYCDKMEPTYEKVKSLLAGNPDQVKSLLRVKELGDRARTFADETLAEFKQGGSIHSFSLLSSSNSKFRTEGLAVLEEVVTILGEMRNSERKGRPNFARKLLRNDQSLRLTLLGGVVLNVGLALLVAGAYRQNLVVRLERVAQNCRRLSLEMELGDSISGDDEIARLDAVFHRMADDLKEAARRERAVVEDALDVICSINREGVIQTVNRAGERLWGRARSDLLLASIAPLVHEDDYGNLMEVLSAGQAPPMEVRVVSDSGLVVDTRWAIRRSPEEEVSFCVIRDISAEKETEKLKSYFVSMVTHDLRTPINSVHNMLSLLDEGAYGKIDDASLKLSLSARMGCEGLVKVISDFLDLEKMSSGSFTLQKSYIDMSSLLDAVCDELEGRASRRGVELEFLDATRGCSAQGDAQTLESAFRDLAAAAVEHVGAQRQVCVRLDQKDDFARVRIEGASPGGFGGALIKSFDELFQAATPDFVSFEELLRLARARELILLHSGRITMAADSTVEVLIPAGDNLLDPPLSTGEAAV